MQVSQTNSLDGIGLNMIQPGQMFTVGGHYSRSYPSTYMKVAADAAHSQRSVYGTRCNVVDVATGKLMYLSLWGHDCHLVGSIMLTNPVTPVTA